MNRVRCFVAVVAACAAFLSACGKSSQQSSGGAKASRDSTRSSALAATIKARGLVVLRDDPAPAQRSSRNASLIVYRTADGGKGGVIYVTRPLDVPQETIGWHWYFTDAAPDSAVMMEINRDGLWDARIYFGDRAVDMVQGESFSLLGHDRGGSEAFNGASSSPMDSWKCFDGDSTTAWQSAAKDAYVEMPVPLGVTDAQLEVQLAKRNRPSKLDIYAGGQKLQTIQLSDGTSRQDFSLDPAVRDASAVRVQIAGAPGDSVAISELEIR